MIVRAVWEWLRHAIYMAQAWAGGGRPRLRALEPWRRAAGGGRSPASTENHVGEQNRDLFVFRPRIAIFDG